MGTDKVMKRIEHLIEVLEFATVSFSEPDLFEEILLVLERQAAQIEHLVSAVAQLAPVAQQDRATDF